uniref:Cadherin domain-containing protein n=1 Tax=Sander lucioperca TaxID=283035 RepID=A0A8C9Y2T6_SANLU
MLLLIFMCSGVVEVQVTDVNDNSPVFTSDSVTTSVPEDAEVGSNVTVVPATDKDSSFNKEIRYSLRGGEGKFSVDPVSGRVSVTGALDRETKAEYSLLMVAEDQGRPARSATASLLVRVSDINDNAPKFSNAEYQGEVLETVAVGTSLLTLSAVDPDEGANGSVTYSILSQSPSSDSPVFELDSSSGTLVTGALDRETKAEYSLLMVAEDQGRPARSATASLLVRVSDINDNAPKFSNAEYQGEVLETASVGASLLTLSAVDPDEGANGSVTYSILSQSPSSDSPVFELDSSSGTLQLAQPLDYSEVKVYSLVVQASDGGTPSLVGNGSVVVKVKDENNNPPEFSKESYDVAVSENLASGASILTLEVNDRDEVSKTAGKMFGFLTLICVPPACLWSPSG